MFNRNIAIDKDDTLNWLTKDICERAGIHMDDIPTLDIIKSGRAIKEFYVARDEFFEDPSNFANAPYGLAHKIVEKAKEYDFNPLVCTKTMSDHPRGGEIVMHKFNFLNEHFKGVEAQIVVGRKFPDAIGLIDDSYNNGLHFNKTANRPFLVWNHKTGTEETLDVFYTYADYFYNVAIEDGRIMNGKKYTHVIKKEKDSDYESLELKQCMNDDDDVFIGCFIIKIADSARLCEIYAEKSILEASKTEFDALMENTVGSDSYFSDMESESCIKTICYNLQSKYLS